IPGDVCAQLERELGLIEELDYPGYFLTVWEVVRFCREQGILCQGRGSAANSAVCYCLGVTAVDPVRMGLLFERFISRERREPPDIDLDIAHERREEVIQHVYKKYGRTPAAMVANVIRYRARSAVREVGKVLGLPETAVDRMARLISRYHSDASELLRQAGLDAESPVHRHLIELTAEIEDFPRHLSIHPGGFLIGHEPVSDLVPIENGSMEDRTVIQWDKDDLEELGLFKVDLLGLGALALIDRALQMIERHKGKKITLATIPHEDPATYEMLCRADTVGVFQIESRAQMSMLPRLRPQTFYDIVIEVSIVRPGPVVGKMVHPYLRRRHGQEPVTYPHPCLEPVLARTLGVPLFQEQVMRLAVVAADYTPGEADQLRRDMAAWRRSGRIERHRVRLIERMLKKGIALEFAERVFEQIRGFGSYGFPESHAASFALLAYATAWLKCHHPTVFMCALLNAQPMGFYNPSTIVEDAKRHGVIVHGACVIESEWDCTLQRLEGVEPEDADADADDVDVAAGPGAATFQPAIHHAMRTGLRYVHGLGESAGQRIIEAREQQLFHDLLDFVRRTRLDTGRLQSLAEAGALRCFDIDRREALWAVLRALPDHERTPMLAPADDGTDLNPIPEFEALTTLDTVLWDHQALSLSPAGHPLGPLREQLRSLGLPDAETVRNLRDGSYVHYAGLVICRQQPGTAKGVVFMTVEDETGFVNVILWQRVFQEYALLARTEGFLGISGKLQNREGTAHLVADRLWKPALRQRAPVRSRDFH
ncbi:MAG: error-prone DNA polymerase, partial [Planctomycetota bacterium]